MDDLTVRGFADPGNLGIVDDLVAVFFIYALRQALADLSIIHDSAFGHVDGCDAGGVWFELSEAFLGD